jgi:hypothetical protein
MKHILFVMRFSRVFLRKNSKELSPLEEKVFKMILVRALGTVQSIKSLMVLGYYYEASILDRTFMEAIGLCAYLKLNRTIHLLKK